MRGVSKGGGGGEGEAEVSDEDTGDDSGKLNGNDNRISKKQRNFRGLILVVGIELFHTCPTSSVRRLPASHRCVWVPKVRF